MVLEPRVSENRRSRADLQVSKFLDDLPQSVLVVLKATMIRDGPNAAVWEGCTQGMVLVMSVSLDGKSFLRSPQGTLSWRFLR